MMTSSCCAECGEEGGGVSLKLCKSCMLVKYCNTNCQRNHWPKHKQVCKRRAAELRDVALFKDPPPKEECPICFLPIPVEFVSCVSLPDATTLSVPIYDFANEHVELAAEDSEVYYPCCGKTICQGCVYSSSRKSGNHDKCPFCNSYQGRNTTEEEDGEATMKRVEANDAGAIFMLGNYYFDGTGGLQQDHTKGLELLARAVDLGYSKGSYNLATVYYQGGDFKKAKFHYEAAAMAGHEVSRYNLGCFDADSNNVERAIKHWMIAASAGQFKAMHTLTKLFEKGVVSRESIDSTLKAYNNSCAEVRSEARDACIDSSIDRNKL